MISAPQILFSQGATISSPGIAPITVTPGVTTDPNDLIYVNVSLRYTTNQSGGTIADTTVTDSQGNHYNNISNCTEGGPGSGAPGPPTTVFIQTGTFVSTCSIALGVSDTITVTFDGQNTSKFEGDVVIQGFSCTGPTCSQLGINYTGPNDDNVTPIHTPANFSIAAPSLNVAPQIIVGTTAATSATITDPAGWTKLQTKTQGSLEHVTYYRIVNSIDPTLFNPTLSVGTGYANYLVDSFYEGPVPLISGLSDQFQGSLSGSTIAWDANSIAPTNKGDLIFVVVALTGSMLVQPTVTDSSGNTYQPGSTVNGSGFAVFSFYCLAADQLLEGASFTVNCVGSGGLSGGTAAAMSVASCGAWTYGGANPGFGSMSATPSYSVSAGQSPSFAFGYAAALTSAITDPGYTQGWGLCPSPAEADEPSPWISLYGQFTESGSLAISPTLGSAVQSLLNIDTFYVSHEAANWPQAGTPILYADFLAGTYQLNGATSSLGALFEQGFGETGAVLVDDNGLLSKVGTSQGSLPVATSALLTALDAQIGTGLVVVCEWVEDIFKGATGPNFDIVEIDSSTGFVHLSQRQAANDPRAVLNTFISPTSILSQGNPQGYYQTMNLGSTTQAAFSFSPSSASISTNGGPVTTAAVSPQAFPLDFLSFGGAATSENNTVQGVHIRMIAIFPLSAIPPSSLPNFSARCSRLGAPPAQRSQGHIF